MIFYSCEETVTYILVACKLNPTLCNFKSKHNNGVEISMCIAWSYIRGILCSSSLVSCHPDVPAALSPERAHFTH